MKAAVCKNRLCSKFLPANACLCKIFSVQNLLCVKVCVKAALFKGWNPPCLQTYSWKHFLQTFLGNLAWGPVPWNLAWQLFRNPCLGTLPGNLFLGTCKYGSQKGFPSKIPGTVSKQGSKQEQGSQEQILKQAFPGRAGSKAKFPGATGNPCLRTSSWEPCLRTSS